MVMVKCRKCGADVSSDEKAKKCRNCGELLPFECAVCGRHLRPPVPDFPIEKYFTDDGKPLCPDHYLRQCPECSKWFRADENPGYFLCPACSANRESQGDDDEYEEDETETGGRKSGCGLGVLCLTIGAGLLYSLTQTALAAWR